jgi:hypothetical protein
VRGSLRTRADSVMHTSGTTPGGGCRGGRYCGRRIHAPRPLIGRAHYSGHQVLGGHRSPLGYQERFAT